MIQYKSINHLNTSLSDREKFSMQFNHGNSGPSVFLQTCNRVELYYGDGDIPDDVSRHLFRVVCGLESAIVGEKAVQGQVKDAYLAARNSQKLPTPMHKLFESALQIGKRVRNETEISHGAVSHSLATIEIIEQEKVDLLNARITIIGVNKLTADIIKFLHNKGAKLVFLANRTEGKARKLAEPYGIDVFTLSDKSAFMHDTDILISATSAPGAIISKADINPDRPLLAIDLAFPRDIDPDVTEYKNVRLYNLHDVEEKVKSNISVREDEVKKAEALIEEEIEELHDIMERRKRYTHDNHKIRIIARGSRLSRIQVDEFMTKFPEVEFEVEYISSFGDKNQKISLLDGEAPDDMFTRELDLAIIEGRADIAVHSAKDLPVKLDERLKVAAIYEAFDKTDSLVSRDHIKLADLPAQSTVGTSSPLRKKELLALRPDIQIVGIRGCIEDRVAQVRNGKIDAAIVATCALKRLGMESEITEILPFETHPMQGRLAVTCKADNDLVPKLFSRGNIL